MSAILKIVSVVIISMIIIIPTEQQQLQNQIHTIQQEQLSLKNTDITIIGLLNESNRIRIENDLPPFDLNNKLLMSSLNKANLMLKDDCWSHYCPDAPWGLIISAGYNYRAAAENLAEGHTNLNILMDAWMHSPDHRINILNPRFKDIGFAIVQGDFLNKKNNTIVVVHFGSLI